MLAAFGPAASAPPFFEHNQGTPQGPPQGNVFHITTQMACLQHSPFLGEILGMDSNFTPCCRVWLILLFSSKPGGALERWRETWSAFLPSRV